MTIFAAWLATRFSRMPPSLKDELPKKPLRAAFSSPDTPTLAGYASTHAVIAGIGAPPPNCPPKLPLDTADEACCKRHFRHIRAMFLLLDYWAVDGRAGDWQTTPPLAGDTINAARPRVIASTCRHAGTGRHVDKHRPPSWPAELLVVTTHARRRRNAPPTSRPFTSSPESAIRRP